MTGYASTDKGKLQRSDERLVITDSDAAQFSIRFYRIIPAPPASAK